MTHDAIAAQIRDRLAELETEAASLRAALEALKAESPEPGSEAEHQPEPKPRRRRREPPSNERAPRRRGAAQPARPGARREEALALIEQRPGIKAGELGPALGAHDTYGYTLVRQLAAAGEIEQGDDKGWKRVAPAEV